MAKRGHDVYLLAPDKPETEPLEGHKDIYSYYGVEQNFEVVKIPWVPIKGKAVIYKLLAVFKTLRLKVDLVYGRDLYACSVATLLNKPLVFEAHEPIIESKLNESAFLRVKKSTNFKNLVVISEALKNYFVEEQNVAENKIIIAHDGADELAERKADIILPDQFGNKESINVGYIGSLYPGRGIGIIISLANSFKDINFHIIGGTEEDIQYWQSEKGNLKNLKFHGFIPNGELSHWYYKFDILLAPYEKRFL